MPHPQEKCMDFPFLYQGGSDLHPNHFLFHGNREYVRDVAGAEWVRLWVCWGDIQGQFPKPGSYEEHCNQLNSSAAAPWINRLDEIIRAANDDRKYVVLCMYPRYPLWAVPVTSSEPGTGKHPSAHFPNADISGPWDHFISYIYNRYRFQQPDTPPNNNGFYNPVGPSAQTGWNGNPRRAYISALEIVNEPNWMHWPQSGNNGDVACYTAKMMQTAENAVNFWNGIAGGYGPGLLAPALADTPIDRFVGGVKFASDYHTTASSVLEILKDWRPRVWIAWSHHNYGDWDSRGTGGTEYPRMASMRDLLYQKNWRGGGDRNVWVTEGGFRMNGPNPSDDQKNRQNTSMSRTWNDFLAVPEAVLFTNFTRHTIDGSDLHTGVRHFNTGTTFPASTTFANI